MEETTKEYGWQELEDRYHQLTSSAICQLTFTTECVGGMPAGEEGVKNYVAHHLQLIGAEAEAAVKRILAEEIGERPIPHVKNGEVDQEAELDERQVYGINVIRRDEYGPWLGDWMVKACLKAAASRVGVFKKKIGTKGDLSEMGRVVARGNSFLNPAKPQQIYPYGTSSVVETSFQKFLGRVNTPQGSKSIVHWSEVIPAGSRLAFEFRFAGSRLSEDDLLSVFAAAANIGFGSVKAMERGKFRIDKLVTTFKDRKEPAEAEEKKTPKARKKE